MVKLEGSDRTTWLCIYVPSSLSLAASVWMLSTYYIFPKLQTPTIRLVMLKTIVQVIYALVYGVAFYNVPSSDTLACRLQGWGITFSVNCSVLLTAAMAGYMVLTIEKKQRITLTYTILAIISVVVAIISSILASIPLLFDQYANVGARCWIAEDEDGRDRQTGSILRFTVYYDVIWTCIVFIVVCYYKVIRYLHLTNSLQSNMAVPTNKARKVTSSSDARAESVISTNKDRNDLTRTSLENPHAKFVHRTISVLLMYPVMCIFAWTPITLLRIIDAIDPSYVPSESFMGVSMVAARSQGILFGIVFWNYREVNREWRRFFNRYYSAVVTSLCPMAAPSAHSSNVTGSSDMGGGSGGGGGGGGPIAIRLVTRLDYNNNNNDNDNDKASTVMKSGHDSTKQKTVSEGANEEPLMQNQMDGGNNSSDGAKSQTKQQSKISIFRNTLLRSFGRSTPELLLPASKSSSESSPPLVDPTFDVTFGVVVDSSSHMRLSSTINHLASMFDMELPEEEDSPASLYMTPSGTSNRHNDVVYSNNDQATGGGAAAVEGMEMT